ncbi:class I glutamine amidotransferase-like protein [Venturia nashicola]|nr:class I glutamine amidotransferase-like protein [Venturia nashicola]
MASEQDLPRNFGLLLYPGFEALDAFGPMEVINDLSRTKDITLSIIAETLSPVSTLLPGTHKVGQQILPTHTFTTAPTLDVLIIPGGWGAVDPAPEPELLTYLSTIGPKLPHLITVCNGSTLPARVGLLDGKNATSNKALWKICTASSKKTNWIAKARWVRDGNVWTASGVSAGIDVMCAWVESVYGKELADEAANTMEFVRAKGSGDDPFAGIHGCEDVLAMV